MSFGGIRIEFYRTPEFIFCARPVILQDDLCLGKLTVSLGQFWIKPKRNECCCFRFRIRFSWTENAVATAAQVIRGRKSKVSRSKPSILRNSLRECLSTFFNG